ncbi:GNAT family N-acetyltransferase [Gluconacetobacter sacchari]|uniref:GNAT family N-acetyltransferase n=1 Tax=Gluconacetobacter sacchari TaxID=92759 RepID=UPI0039B5F193
MEIRQATPPDKSWIKGFLIKNWGDTIMVVRGKPHDLLQYPCMMAANCSGNYSGLLIWKNVEQAAEILAIGAAVPNQGVGGALLDALLGHLSKLKIQRLSVITTNDNLSALRFYQRRGFRLTALDIGAMDKARKIKPLIPLVGEFGIPIRDELELGLGL